MSNTKKKNKPKVLRTDAAAEKATINSRVACSALVGQKGPQCPLWTAEPTLQDSGAKLIAAGISLANAEKAVVKAESDAEMARAARDTMLVAWDLSYDVFAANARQVAPKPEDLAALGLSALERNSFALAMPLGVKTAYDLTQRAILIHVQHAPGMTACEVEISQNPADPASWKRVKGNGARRKLTGLASGTWYVRAASVRAEEESDYTMPVSVVVP